jgi:hypothetical protein
MRLLQLNPDGTEESALDFHPIITVVNGLGVGGREVVIRAITAMARGKDPGIGGLLEAHGVMLDLTADTLSLLDVHTDLDVLLDSKDVPSVAEHEPPDVDTPTRPSAEQLLQSTAPGAHPELDEARKRQSDAAEALAVLRDATERSQNDHLQARRRLDRARAAVDGARAALEGALAGLAEDTASLEQLRPDEIAARRDEVVADVEQLRSDLERIDRGLKELSAIDTRPIQVLLDAIANPDPVELVASGRAQELADDFVRLQAEVKDLEVRLVGVGRDPATANAQLEEARAELALAEKGMAKPDLSADDVAELEAAHQAVLDAERKASGRFNRNKKSLEDAMVHEQQILDRVGFPTWSAYVMGSGLLAIDPAAEERLEKARFEFEAAEANWAQVSEAIEADPELSGLLDQLEAVYLEAFDLLGGQEPDDLEAALRNHREPKREVSTEELVDALAYQLELVGLDLGPAATVDRTVVVAQAFLAETSGLNDRVTELEAERHHVSGALEEAEEELATLPADGSTIDATSIPAPQVDVHLTQEDIAELEAELAAATEAEAEAADRAEAREALLDAATQVQAVATARLLKVAGDLAERSTDVAVSAEPASAFEVPVDEVDDGREEALEFYLLARLASLRNVSFAGAVPLVVDDAFGGLPRDELRKLLGKLERMAEAVQIIYLTDDEAITDWATEVGFQRAAVVEAAGPFR